MNCFTLKNLKSRIYSIDLLLRIAITTEEKESLSKPLCKFATNGINLRQMQVMYNLGIYIFLLLTLPYFDNLIGTQRSFDGFLLFFDGILSVQCDLDIPVCETRSGMSELNRFLIRPIS